MRLYSLVKKTFIYRICVYHQVSDTNIASMGGSIRIIHTSAHPLTPYISSDSSGVAGGVFVDGIPYSPLAISALSYCLPVLVVFFIKKPLTCGPGWTPQADLSVHPTH